MELVDIKRTKADKTAEKKRWDEPMNADDYPYGLTISLDDATIKKLKLGDMDAEQEVRVEAIAFVSEDNANKRNGKTVRSMQLQITKLAVVQGETKEDMAKAMYDN